MFNKITIFRNHDHKVEITAGREFVTKGNVTTMKSIIKTFSYDEFRKILRQAGAESHEIYQIIKNLEVEGNATLFMRFYNKVDTIVKAMV